MQLRIKIVYFQYHLNRPFSYSENECGSNDISLQFLEFSNLDNCDPSFNATLSNLEYKIVSKYRSIQALL